MNSIGKKKSIFLLCLYFIGYLLFLNFTSGLLIGFNLVSQETMSIITILEHILFVVFVVYYLRDFLKQELAIFKKNILKNSFSVLGHYGLLLVLNMIITLALSFLKVTYANQEALNTALNQSMLPVIIMAVVFAPLVEELIFRGIIFNSLYKKNKILAYLVSGVLFGLGHILISLISLDFIGSLAILTYISMGLVMCRIYSKQKTFIAPFLVHLLNNTIAILLMIFL